MLKLSKVIHDLQSYYNEYGDLDMMLIVNDSNMIREIVSTGVTEITQTSTGRKIDVAFISEIEVD